MLLFFCLSVSAIFGSFSESLGVSPEKLRLIGVIRLISILSLDP